MALAADEGQGRVPLSLQAVLLLVQALVRGLACVDGATLFGRERRVVLGGRFHAAPTFRARLVGFNPKNTGPEYDVPLMARATAERLLKARPSRSKRA